ncbi:hypothetical protein J41TS4_07870 [Paenibacillus apis]|uniref:AraC effector-binding domain-containing protein n=1 Tax=Paenibacillus apis TaxID=1792174 RepID=A0A919XXY4_9BACL|nr:hypothetical protein J41TS4_07870 [Paenibacillus apis]
MFNIDVRLLRHYDKISFAEDLEQPIRELELRNSLNSVMFLGKVGVSISCENLLNRNLDRFSSIFVVLEPGDDDAEDTFCLPGGRYLTLRFHGTHKKAEPAYIKMFQYMDQKGYVPAGDSLEFALIDYGLTNDPSKFTTEIQIPYQTI